MLTGVINSCDAAAEEVLEHVARLTGLIGFAHLPPRQLQNYELVRAVNGHEADVVFLDFVDRHTASAQAELLKRDAPGVARVGYLSDQPGEYDENPAPELVDAWLSMPPTPDGLNRTLWQALHRPESRFQRPLYLFLPAKAGCGCTTIALHVADALANGIGRRTLFIDADRHSGVLELMLNTSARGSVADLLEQSSNLTPALWNVAAQGVGKLDVLMNHLDQIAPAPHWSSYHKLLRYASTHYETVVADLPEAPGDAARELITQARFILVVTTMELAPMKLATRRLRELREAGADMDKVWLVLNRWHRRNLNRADAEKLLHIPVAGVIPNDYKTFQSALQIAGFVNPATPAGHAIGELANHLAGIKPPPEDGNKLLRLFAGK